MVAVVVVTMVGVAAATVVTRGPLPLLLVVLEAAAPAAHPTQHTHITTITMGTTMNSTIPATVTPTIRPTRLTAWKEHNLFTKLHRALKKVGPRQKWA